MMRRQRNPRRRLNAHAKQVVSRTFLKPDEERMPEPIKTTRYPYGRLPTLEIPTFKGVNFNEPAGQTRSS